MLSRYPHYILMFIRGRSEKKQPRLHYDDDDDFVPIPTETHTGYAPY